ncbi:MAG: DNA repair protein RadA [Clostridia bacterium]|nr:MAG: DNA repair protein RadA [Clostridia bacterium]
MARERVQFVCQECGLAVPKWLGRCPGCGQWNSLVEEIQAGVAGLRGAEPARSGALPVAITEVDGRAQRRISTGLNELDRVLGGGIVPGSLVLVGGPPGIGKSTLLLQLAAHVATNSGAVLYISGEESLAQVRMRAERLGALTPGLMVAGETNVEGMKEIIGRVAPLVCVVDSVQTIYKPDLGAAPGSVAQVREAAADLLRVAKEKTVAIFLVGHVTKEGMLAGPRVLEHLVDAVLYFEGDRHSLFRLVRAVKNRFGAADEVGIFAMQAGGLAEVGNPSASLLSQRPAGVPGSVVAASLEGTRPLLVEVQALVAPTVFGNPRRLTTGLDNSRALLMLAILEKRVGLNLGLADVYLNVAGGVQVEEPAMDLGICLAVASSFLNRPDRLQSVVTGEVGLTGEVRAVSQVEKRLREAAQLGFRHCLAPAGSQAGGRALAGLEVHEVATVSEALHLALGTLKPQDGS